MKNGKWKQFIRIAKDTYQLKLSMQSEILIKLVKRKKTCTSVQGRLVFLELMAIFRELNKNDALLLLCELRFETLVFQLFQRGTLRVKRLLFRRGF